MKTDTVNKPGNRTHDAVLRDEILKLVIQHGKSTGKVMKSFRIKWIKEDDKLVVDECDVMYKFLPEPIFIV